MAGADVIEAAIGITLLIVVSYVVIGSIMTTAEVVSNTQKDMTLLQQERLGTAIGIPAANYRPTYVIPGGRMDFQIKNTGNQIINYTTMEVIVTWGTGAPVFYTYGNGYSGTWHCIGINPDTIHPKLVDSGEVLDGRIYDGMGDPPGQPDAFGVVTSNGIINSTITIT
jgi:flagellar protein FlaF